MSRRVAHMIKNEMSHPSRTQVHGEVTSTPWMTWYWCGKVEKTIREEPLILTDEEIKRFEKQSEKLKQNPPPVCAKCRKAKDKYNDRTRT